jgi:hypothetical protein
MELDSEAVIVVIVDGAATLHAYFGADRTWDAHERIPAT